METEIEKRITDHCVEIKNENLNVTTFGGHFNVEGKPVTILHNKIYDRWYLIIEDRIFRISSFLKFIFSMYEIAAALVHTELQY